MGRCLRLAAPMALLVLGGASAASASGRPSPESLPLAAQVHAYRHGVVPTRGAQLASTTLAPISSLKQLGYGGAVSGVGVTTGAPLVYLVFWGSQWGTQGSDANGDVTLSGDPSGMAPYLQEFMKGLGTGGETWSGVMTQYCQGVSTGAKTCPTSSTEHVGYPTGGALAGVWVDKSSAAPQQASADQIDAEAISAAGHFSNTNSTANRNAQYVIVSPTGTTPDGFNTASSTFCAWHDYTGDGYAAASPYGPLAFTNLPYLPDAGSSCGQAFVNPGSAGSLDGVSIVEGHEYAETITDQFPAGGWTVLTQSSTYYGEENGDLCAWIGSGQGASQDIALATGTFAVQSTWANDFNNGAGGCEVSHPIVPNSTSGNTVTVTNPGAQTTLAAQAVSLPISASDSDSAQALTYSATQLPTGLTIDPASGVIGGTPISAGTFAPTVTATDPTGASSNTTFTWAIAPRATASSFSCAATSLLTGSSTSCEVTVSDTSPGTLVAPAGNVSFTETPTFSGTFTGMGTCALVPTAAPGTSSCQTAYTPAAAGPQTLTATYQADGVHAGSPSSTSITVSAPSLDPSPAPASTQGGQSTTATASSTTPPAGGPAATSRPSSGAGCPAATGRLGGGALGLVRIGMTRRQVRAAYSRSMLTFRAAQDTFCLAGGSIHVGYPSARVLRLLSPQLRRRLAGRAEWLTSANPQFHIGSTAPGAGVGAAARLLSRAKTVTAGRNTWYVVSSGNLALLVEVSGGRVREAGVATGKLTRNARVLAALVASLA